MELAYNDSPVCDGLYMLVSCASFFFNLTLCNSRILFSFNFFRLLRSISLRFASLKTIRTR